ncbi:MAG: acyltransferase [Clostridium sp.]
MKVAYSKNNEINYISLLKNIAIILVVVGHAGCIYAGKWSFPVVHGKSEKLRYITEYIYSFHMPLFVFISGYIYNYNKEKLGKSYSLYKLTLNKSKRLLLPYFTFGIFFMIPVQMIFNVYQDNTPFISRAINEIILARRPTHLWYLLMLFSLFILFKIIENTINKNNYIVNLLIFTLVYIASYDITRMYGAYYITFSLKYLIFFYMGYILSRNIDKIKVTPIKIITYFVAHLALFNIKYFSLFNINLSPKYNKLFNILTIEAISILGIIFMFYFALYICKSDLVINKITNNKLYKLINECNFDIYLFHHPIMLSIIALMKNVNISPKMLFVFLSITTLILSIMVSKLVTYGKHMLFKDRIRI